jgi:hypothetical protein
MNLTLERIANVLQSEVVPYSSVVAEASDEVRLMRGYVVQCQSRLDAGDASGFIYTFGVFRESAKYFDDNILNRLLQMQRVEPRVLDEVLSCLIRINQKVGVVEGDTTMSMNALIGNLLEMMAEIRLLSRFVNSLKKGS